MSDAHRGERQQIERLERAKEEIEDALDCHNAGMMDPALARADTAGGYLEDYRKGPMLRNTNQEREEEDD